MKKKEIRIRILCGVCVAFCWWGLLYPEFSMTPDTYNLPAKEAAEWNSDGDVYRLFLETDREQIRFKSRLLEYLRR